MEGGWLVPGMGAPGAGARMLRAEGGAYEPAFKPLSHCTRGCAAAGTGRAPAESGTTVFVPGAVRAKHVSSLPAGGPLLAVGRLHEIVVTAAWPTGPVHA